jgi:hypothetical protein
MGTTRSQGIDTIEPAERGGFLVCLPNGRVEQRERAISGEALCAAWAGRNVWLFGAPTDQLIPSALDAWAILASETGRLAMNASCEARSARPLVVRPSTVGTAVAPESPKEN